MARAKEIKNTNKKEVLLMAIYTYPAIFTPEPDGGLSIDFPDLEGYHTCGDDMAERLMMAEDALALILYGYETDGREILSV